MRNRILLLFLAVILLFSGVSCGFAGKGTPSGTLTVFVSDNDKNIIAAINKFNESSKNIKIKEKVYFSDQYKQLSEDLQNGLKTAGGPDIIIAPPYMLPDLSKYVENGSFCPLDDLISKDTSFNLADYNQKVMNAGIYNQKRYLLPLSYTVNALFTTSEILKKNNIEMGAGPHSMQDFASAASKYMKEQAGNNKYFLSSLDLITILSGAGNTFIDMENKSAKLNTQSFKELMESYRSLYPAICPLDRQEKFFFGGDQSKSLVNGDVIFLNTITGGPKNLWNPYNAFSQEVEPVICDLPAVGSGSHTVANIKNFAAINSKCSNKAEAFKFIKLLLSSEFQEDDFLYSIPVNNQALEKVESIVKKDETKENGILKPRGGGCKSDASAGILIGRLNDMIAALGDCRIVDNSLMGVLSNELVQYADGSKPLDAAIRSMQAKAMSYFSTKLDTGKAATVSESKKAGELKSVSLKLSYMDYDKGMSNAIRICNEKYPNIQIESTVFEFSRFEEYQKKLASEVMAGEGPDVITFQNSTFNSIHKSAASGVFCDLNDLISKDKEFKLSDYYPKVMDSGVIDGKRYLIPLRYTICTLYSTKGILKNNGINTVSPNWTINDLGNMAKAFRNAGKENEFFLDCNFGFIGLLSNSGFKLIDYKTLKTNFNSKEFIELLNTYRDIYQTIGSVKLYQQLGSPRSMLKNKGAVMMSDKGQMLSPDQLWSLNSGLRQTLGEGPVIMAYPTYDGSGAVQAKVSDYAAINANCRDKAAALDFIKILLSKDIQKSMDSHGNNNITFGLPVNIKAYEEDRDYYMSDSSVKYATISDSQGYITPLKLPTELAAQMDSMIAKAQVTGIVDTEVYSIVYDELDRFLNGKKSAEETAKTIDRKVSLYLNE